MTTYVSVLAEPHNTWRPIHDLISASLHGHLPEFRQQIRVLGFYSTQIQLFNQIPLHNHSFLAPLSGIREVVLPNSVILLTRKLRLNEREWPAQGLKDKVSNGVTQGKEPSSADWRQDVRNVCARPQSPVRELRGKDEGSREPSLYNLV